MSLNSIYTNPLLWVNQGFEWRHVNCLFVSGIDTYWVFSAAGILCDSNADREIFTWHSRLPPAQVSRSAPHWMLVEEAMRGAAFQILHRCRQVSHKQTQQHRKRGRFTFNVKPLRPKPNVQITHSLMIMLYLTTAGTQNRWTIVYEYQNWLYNLGRIHSRHAPRAILFLSGPDRGERNCLL